jgi:hypothetical protein
VTNGPGTPSGISQAAAGLPSLGPHGRDRTSWRPHRPRLVALDRHADPIVLPLAEEECAIARDILHRPAFAASSIPFRLHHGPQVRLRTERLRLDHATEPVANHKPARLLDRQERIRFPSSSSHDHSMPQRPTSPANPTDDPCMLLPPVSRRTPIARFHARAPHSAAAAPQPCGHLGERDVGAQHFESECDVPFARVLARVTLAVGRGRVILRVQSQDIRRCPPACIPSGSSASHSRSVARATARRGTEKA